MRTYCWVKARGRFSKGWDRKHPGESALTRTLENSQFRREDLDWGTVGDWLRMHVDSGGEVARIASDSSSTTGFSFSALVGKAVPLFG